MRSLLRVPATPVQGPGFARFPACKTNKHANKQAGTREGITVNKQIKELILGRGKQNLSALWKHEKIRKEVNNDKGNLSNKLS